MKNLTIILSVCLAVAQPCFGGSNHQIREQRQRAINEEAASYYMKNKIITPEILRRIERHIPPDADFSFPWRAGCLGFYKLISRWKGEIEARYDGTIYLNGVHIGNWR